MTRDPLNSLLLPRVVLSAVALCAGSFAAAEPQGGGRGWTDAYQQSPARYEVLEDTPEAVKQYLTPREVGGTIRTTAVVSIGGKALRVRFTNETGDAPLPIAEASVALANAAGEPAGPLMPLTFGGRPDVTIPAGAPSVSDPAALVTRAQDRVVISFYTTGKIGAVVLGGSQLIVAPGNQTSRPTLQDGRAVMGRSPVSGVQVETTGRVPVVVTLGDSITDGARTGLARPAGYPAVLARRLASAPSGRQMAVVNAGIGGNRLLERGSGAAALARLDRDVLRIDRLGAVLLLEGINDIGRSGVRGRPVIQPEAIIAAYRQIIARVHARGARIIGGTLLPFAGAAYHSPEKEAVRQAVNTWIRTSGAFDGVVDFDVVMRDPANPLALKPAYDSGDHLHPNDAGYVAMGEAIDLRLFR